VSPVRRGDAVLEMSADPDRPLRIRDAATGAVRADIASWQAVNPDDEGTMVVWRAETDRRVTAFGALLPGSATVRPLGVSTQFVDDCVADQRLVACRSPAGLEVWSYRA
jgi:hypothetical protein